MLSFPRRVFKGLSSRYSRFKRKDPQCMYVDPAVMTCYPTNETVAVQNKYTRVICKFPPPSLSPRASLVALSVSVSLSGRPRLPQLACAPQIYAVLPISGALPYISGWFRPAVQPDQIWTPRDPTQIPAVCPVSRHCCYHHPSP